MVLELSTTVLGAGAIVFPIGTGAFMIPFTALGIRSTDGVGAGVLTHTAIGTDTIAIMAFMECLTMITDRIGIKDAPIVVSTATVENEPKPIPEDPLQPLVLSVGIL